VKYTGLLSGVLASWAVCSSGAPPYIFLNLYGIATTSFGGVFLEKRLDVKSLKRQTKAEELRTPGPELLSLRLSLKTL
jgi:hypothetical protein